MAEKKYRMPKNVPLDADWPSDEFNFREARVFGRHANKDKKSFKQVRGGGAATKGKKFTVD